VGAGGIPISLNRMVVMASPYLLRSWRWMASPHLSQGGGGGVPISLKKAALAYNI